MDERVNSIIGVSIIVILFILCSVIVEKNILGIQTLVAEGGIFAIFAYIFIVIVGIVIAPISTFPLLAVASPTWG